MVQLMKACELKKLTKKNEGNFELNAMNSSEFKNLVSRIETAAEQGDYSLAIDIGGFGGVRKVEVFAKYLKEAGYKVNQSGSTTLHISWAVEN